MNLCKNKRSRWCIALLAVGLVTLVAGSAGAQNPPLINGALYPYTTSVVAKVGDAVIATPADMAGVLLPGNIGDIGVEECSYVAAPPGQPDTLYGDIEDLLSAGIEYTVAEDWWNKPGVIRCEGFQGVTDRFWYKAENVIPGPSGCTPSGDHGFSNYYVAVQFNPDPDQNDPIVANKPVVDSNGVPCTITCVQSSSQCIPLTDLLSYSWTNMSDMFNNPTYTAGRWITDEVFIKTSSQYTPEGACWPVLDKDGEESPWRACYTAGADCIDFTLSDPMADEASLVANSPYTFTVTVTNLVEGESTFTVTLAYPCDCCAKTKKLLQLTVEEGQAPTNIPWTRWFIQPDCGSGLSNDYQIVQDANLISASAWKTTWGGWIDGPGAPQPSSLAVRERLVAQQAFQYTAPPFGYAECCDALDWMYIRVTCYTNTTPGGTATWEPISSDMTQVKITVLDMFMDGTLAATTNDFFLNQPIQGSDDPCNDAIPDGWQPICRGDDVCLPVCNYLDPQYITTSNCYDCLYVDAVGSDMGLNTSHLGGSVNVTPGDQVNAQICYVAPSDVQGVVTDWFDYVVGDMCDPEASIYDREHTSKRVYVVIDDCDTCVPSSESLVVDVCNIGETNVVTAEMIADQIVFCETGDVCLASIVYNPQYMEQQDCAITNQGPFGTWRVNYSPGCPGTDCDECLSELVYIGLAPDYVGVGVDAFIATVNLMQGTNVVETETVDVLMTVRPVVNPSQLVTVDVETDETIEGDPIMQDEYGQAVYDVEALEELVSGYEGLPVRLYFERTTENGGTVALDCEEVVDTITGEYVYYMGQCPCEFWSAYDCGCTTGSTNTDVMCALVYDPPRGFFGTDTVTYWIEDGTLAECGGELNRASGTIEITVTRDLRSPIANDDEYQVEQGQILSVGIPGVLANDFNPLDLGQEIAPNLALMFTWLVDEPMNGQVTLGNFGEFGYEPDPGFYGVDTFTYICYAPEFFFDLDNMDDFASLLDFDWYNGLWSQEGTVYINVTPMDYIAHDFNGVGEASIAVISPNSTWYTRNAAGTGGDALHWGWQGTVAVPGDYDGDGVGDKAVYDPAGANWYILGSTEGYQGPINWGFPGAIPVPADYDGDSATDVAVYYPDGGLWFIMDEAEQMISISWGFPGTQPVPADYDGDGKIDQAVFHGPSAMWYALLSKSTIDDGELSGDVNTLIEGWGWDGVIPCPGNYTGDTKAEIAVYDQATANWYFFDDVTPVNFGPAGTGIPVPADYDGDGIEDPAVYDTSNGNWMFLDAKSEVQWGWSEALPVSSEPALWLQR